MSAHSRFLLSALVVFLIASISSGGFGSITRAASTQQNSKLKIGFIYDGSIHDGGYDESNYLGQQALVRALGGPSKVSVMMVQNTPYTSQLTQIANNMINSGATILVDPAAGGDLFYKACAAHPDVKCVEINGLPPFPSSNIEAIYPKNWLAEYLMGVAAGEVTKTGVIGYLAGFKIPSPIFNAINAMTLGCQSVRPNCKTRVTYVNSWYDPPKETEIANTLTDAGADVLSSGNNDAVVVQVAQKRGKWATGLFLDQKKFGPKAYLTSMIVNWAPAYEREVNAIRAGTWKGGDVYVFGFGQGLSLGTWGPNVPKRVKTAVDKVYNEIRAGKNVFAGPIYDQSGKLQVRRGQKLNDSFLYDRWTWLVKGVISSH